LEDHFGILGKGEICLNGQGAKRRLNLNLPGIDTPRDHALDACAQ
jgi:hypothetical protein